MHRLFLTFFVFIFGSLLPVISMAQLSTETFSQSFSISVNTLDDLGILVNGISIPKFDSSKGILREVRVSSELTSGFFTITGFQVSPSVNNTRIALNAAFIGQTEPQCGIAQLGSETTRNAPELTLGLIAPEDLPVSVPFSPENHTRLFF